MTWEWKIKLTLVFLVWVLWVGCWLSGMFMPYPWKGFCMQIVASLMIITASGWK